MREQYISTYNIVMGQGSIGARLGKTIGKPLGITFTTLLSSNFFITLTTVIAIGAAWNIGGPLLPFLLFSIPLSAYFCSQSELGIGGMMGENLGQGIGGIINNICKATVTPIVLAADWIRGNDYRSTRSLWNLPQNTQPDSIPKANTTSQANAAPPVKQTAQEGEVLNNNIEDLRKILRVFKNNEDAPSVKDVSDLLNLFQNAGNASLEDVRGLLDLAKRSHINQTMQTHEATDHYANTPQVEVREGAVAIRIERSEDGISRRVVRLASEGGVEGGQSFRQNPAHSGR